MITAGTDVTVHVTYLEMLARPPFDRPSVPLGPPLALIRAERPPVWWFLDLYRAVGRDWEWTDRLHEAPESLAAFVQDPAVVLFTLIRSGWPAGFFQLDFRRDAACEIAYFGLVPEAVGQGLGKYLLQTAIHAAWDRPGLARLHLHTCTLDHPAALPLYQSCGFQPYARDSYSHILTQDRPA
ncbi:MAG: GNAT family N-acetyltransferase [Pseudomonadota bacterium]